MTDTKTKNSTDAQSPALAIEKAKGYTESALWDFLRKELSAPLAETFSALLDFGGTKELGELLGLDSIHRKMRVEQILGSWRPATPGDFVAGLKQLQSITHPPEAVELYRQWLASYSLAIVPKCRAILADAIRLAEGKLAEIQKIEKQIFTVNGIAHQKTNLVSGAETVLGRLRSLKSSIDFHNEHAARHLIEPSEGLLGELFRDEAAKWKVEEAAMAARGEGIKRGPNHLLMTATPATAN